MNLSRRVRVLVADDSLTVRKRLVEALSSNADFEVVGEARDGSEAISLCAELRPDVITLDVLMPGMDGVRAAEAIMEQTPTPILVVSAADSRGERLSTLSALAAGAVDVLEKPTRVEEYASFDARFVRALRLVSRVPVVTRRQRKAQQSATEFRSLQFESELGRDVVGIGGSTGGPGALVEVLRELPRDFPLPILVVLHIGPSFGFAVADWLASTSPLPVVAAQNGMSIVGGKVYVCPPDRHLVVQDGHLRLTQEPERHSCRPSVDVLFESLAEQYRSRAIGCLLTGIGRDGAAGLLAMRQCGALTMAQDAASSVVFGMPREAIALGAAAHVASPRSMGSLLISAAARSRMPSA